MLRGLHASVTAPQNDTSEVGLSGASALKVYRIRESDPSNTIFAVSGNFTYDTQLPVTGVPYGDKGFVVMRKGGDASVFRKNQATKTNNGGDISEISECCRSPHHNAPGDDTANDGERRSRPYRTEVILLKHFRRERPVR